MASHLHKTAQWQRIRLEVLTRDEWTCQMCGCLCRTGGSARDSAVADHIRPAALRPELFFDESNLRTVCRACHGGVCASIEARLGEDAEAIAKAKLAYRPVGIDGYPVGGL